jgi:Secretion system C-terminal sorting domain
MKKNQNGAPAMRETKKDSRRKFQRIASMMIVGLLLISGFAFAENGKINLIFTNGSILTSNTEKYYEFDVQAYMSNGSDVIADGMVYVEYPQDVFNNLVVSNDKVTVTKAGILSGTDPILNLDLYRLVNITDTYQNTFAITFESSFSASAPSMKAYYQAVSTDPENPSDLLHVSIQLSQEVDGSICFPATIPGLDYLYYDYEGETFSEGLNIDEANEMIESSTVTPDPVFAGSVDLQSFTTRIKRSNVELAWKTNQEVDLYAYAIERSSNGSNFEELSVVPVETAKGKFNTYKLDDLLLSPGSNYIYQLSAIDLNGNKELLASKTVYLDAGKKTILDDGSFALEASYPNPFNPSFTVPFSVTSSQNVSILLYDLSGKLIQTVADGYYSPGNYKIRVSCDQLVSGVYLLNVRTNDQQAIQKMLLTK